MPLISYSIPHLSNGVSQQPDAMRLPTSCEEMINGWPSLVTGLAKRPPTEHLNVLNISVDKECAGHLINRSTDKQYFVLVSDQDIDIVDEDGVSQAISFPNGKSYLDVAFSPAKSIRFLTVGDFTFIVNKERVVQANNHGEKGRGYEISATYTFNKRTDFPSTGESGATYYAADTNKFYQWDVISSSPSVNGWMKSGTDTVQTTSKKPPTNPGSGRSEYVYTANLPNANALAVGTKRFTSTGGQKIAIYETITRPGPEHGTTRTSRVFKGYEYKWTRTYYDVIQTEPAKPTAYGYVVYEAKDSDEEVNRLNPDRYATVHVTQSNANSYYAIYVNNIKKAEFLTAKGVDAASSVQDTSVIASGLATAMASSGYSTEVFGSTLVISNLSTTDEVYVKGPNGDRAIKTYRDTIKSFNDLPPNEKEGRLVKVQADPDTDGDDYYVTYRNGVWVEEEAYNAGASPDASTMPHVLIRTVDNAGNDVWVFKEHDWSSRIAGNPNSNRHPSFINRRINDIFVFGNRLGFVADENLILSEADHFENFYRTSCATLLESDRIDVAVFNKDVDILNHAIPFNRDIVLMSANSQYRVMFDTYVSPKTVSIQYTTSYNNSPNIKPVSLGTSIYFVDDNRENVWAKVFEYFPRPNNSGDEADEVTAAIPEYIPADMKYLSASPRMNAVVLGNGSNTMYVYKFFWDGDNKIQNAWGKWEFPGCDTVYSTWFLNNYLYLVTKRGTQINLERIRFDEDVFTSAKQFTAYIDRSIRNDKLTVTYNATTKKSTITVPYKIETTPEVVSSSDNIPAFRHGIVSRTIVGNTTQLVVEDDVTDLALRVGMPYTFYYEFSRQYLRRPSAKGSERPMLEGRVQLRYLSLEYHDTAYFQFNVTVAGRPTVTATYNGDVIGGMDTLVGQVNFGSGVQRIPLMASSGDVRLTITNDSPFGNAFGSAEWQAVWTPRSQRIN